MTRALSHWKVCLCLALWFGKSKQMLIKNLLVGSLGWPVGRSVGCLVGWLCGARVTCRLERGRRARRCPCRSNSRTCRLSWGMAMSPAALTPTRFTDESDRIVANALRMLRTSHTCAEDSSIKCCQNKKITYQQGNWGNVSGCIWLSYLIQTCFLSIFLHKVLSWL